MFLVRDIMFCKPGQARPMVQRFLALDKLGRQMGFGSMRVMTDVSGALLDRRLRDGSREPGEIRRDVETIDGNEGISGSDERLPRSRRGGAARDLYD